MEYFGGTRIERYCGLILSEEEFDAAITDLLPGKLDWINTKPPARAAAVPFV